MDAKSPISGAARPGWSSFVPPLDGAGRYTVRESEPQSSLPPAVGVGILDNVRAAFWQAYRHLFPPHALAAQTRHGSLVISWSVLDDPHAHRSYATPVVLRFEAALLQAMDRAGARTRSRIALQHEPTLREGLRGYDPFARFSNARVITLG